MHSAERILCVPYTIAPILQETMPPISLPKGSNYEI